MRQWGDTEHRAPDTDRPLVLVVLGSIVRRVLVVLAGLLRRGGEQGPPR